VEASGFRDAIKDFEKLKARIVGISPDTPAAQAKFKEKYSLPFTLLCDEDRKVAEAYGVLKEKNMYGKMVMGIERTTFLIDASGIIKKIFPKVKVEGHTEEVLCALKA
jgi:peroxiredoxin Q/BCP